MRLIIIILFLMYCIHSVASENIHEQSRLYEDSELYILIEALYLNSSEIPPGSDLILTYQDAISAIASWKENHPEPAQKEQKILTAINRILEKINNKKQIKVYLGLDYLHHNIPDCTETNSFYARFRDFDFQTKYYDRGRFFDATLDLPLYRHLFLSTRTSLRTDWKYFNSRENDFPKNLREFNPDLNEKSILNFSLDNISIIAGRDRLTLGSGEFSKLLISSNLPPVDHFHFSINYKENLAFTFITAWMKNVVIEDERQKIFYAHRLSYRFFNRLYLALTEMQMTNQDLNFKYLNPFMVYHNEYDYPSQRNILTAADVEAAIGYGTKAYASFAVDEIDVSALEENGSKGREAWGLILGIKQIQPLGIFNSHWVLEWTKLTKWMYNHGFPWEDYYSLNYVYEENQDKIEPEEFHRFIGHELGANAEAVMARIHWQGLTLLYKYVEQGTIPILERAFSDVPDPVKEFNNILGIQLQKHFWANQIDLKTGYYYTRSINFHQDAGLNKSYSEFRISLSYRILNINW